jgi:hypothetical protein
MKRCWDCKETKPFEVFSKNSTRKDGYNNRCKACQRAYYEANREKKLEYIKYYQEANREKSREKVSRYRARKHNAIPKFLRNCEVEKQRLRDIYRLSMLLSKATGIEHHVDHMWPISDGGPHWSGNLQVIPAKDNLSKHASVCKETKKAIRESLKIARKEYNDNSRNGH